MPLSALSTTYRGVLANPCYTTRTGNIAMDRQLAIAYRNRWVEVEAIEREEARRATPEQRWRRLVALLRLASAIGLSPVADEGEIELVRARWLKLKSAV